MLYSVLGMNSITKFTDQGRLFFNGISDHNDISSCVRNIFCLFPSANTTTNDQRDTDVLPDLLYHLKADRFFCPAARIHVYEMKSE